MTRSEAQILKWANPVFRQKTLAALRKNGKRAAFREAIRVRMTGTTRSDDVRKKISVSRKGKLVGKDNPWWSGDNVEKKGLHARIKGILGRPDKCALCGLDEQPAHASPKRNYFHLSNKTGVYSSELKNWWFLCARCHHIYDTYELGKPTRNGLPVKNFKKL